MRHWDKWFPFFMIQTKKQINKKATKKPHKIIIIKKLVYLLQLTLLGVESGFDLVENKAPLGVQDWPVWHLTSLHQVSETLSHLPICICTNSHTCMEMGTKAPLSLHVTWFDGQKSRLALNSNTVYQHSFINCMKNFTCESQFHCTRHSIKTYI